MTYRTETSEVLEAKAKALRAECLSLRAHQSQLHDELAARPRRTPAWLLSGAFLAGILVGLAILLVSMK